MQETAKVNYVQYGKSTKLKKKKPQSGAGASGQGAGSHNAAAGSHRGSRPSEKFNKRPPLLPDTCYRCGKGRHQKAQDCQGCGCYMQRVWKERTLWEGLPEGENTLHTLWRPHRPILQGPVNPCISMMRDSQSTLTWSVSPMWTSIWLNFQLHWNLQPWRGIMQILLNPLCCSRQTQVADVNLMNRKTFNQPFGAAKDVLKPTLIKMENYGNTAVKVLGMFHAFLRWKDNVYRQLFYVTDCDRSPNLLSRDACYILGVLKPFYTVENTTKNTSSPTVNASTKGDVVAKSFHHQKMNGSEEKLSNNSNKQSILQSQLQGDPLTKQYILDVFTRIGKFPGMPYKFQLKPNAKPTRHAPRKVPIHLQDTFHKEIRNLEQLGILEETKDVTEWQWTAL